MSINKKELTERDICTKFITPALVEAKWDLMNQIREEVCFIRGRVIVRGQLQDKVKEDAGQTTLPIISKGKWEQLPIPLPPLAEQKRIVAIVNELMHWCDELKAQLAAARDSGAHLLDAGLRQILNHAAQKIPCLP